MVFPRVERERDVPPQAVEHLDGERVDDRRAPRVVGRALGQDEPEQHDGQNSEHARAAHQHDHRQRDEVPAQPPAGRRPPGRGRIAQ
eukprot:scaffold2516_cov108-Isochrysis_galbana.AAC.20